MEYEIAGINVDLTFSQDHLLCWPTEWTEELESHGFIQAAADILIRMPECALRTPWIIGSASRAINGRLRSESRSHMDGLAFDMSPMYSDNAVLSPDGVIMGLAWNVISLSIIHAAYRHYPHFVVEGDHIHVQPNAVLDSSRMLAAFTMPSWYSWTEAIRGDSYTSELDNSFWIWDPESASMRLASMEECDAYLKALRT